MPRGDGKSAADFFPTERTLEAYRQAAQTCRGCELWRLGTQTVFGQGSPDARFVLIGEQPGDEEDRAGVPFVGPAGRMLDAALEAAHVDRAQVYVTNAVKHFKWRPLGKRRMHERPTSGEISRCRPWLLAELQMLAPDVVVALGATAAQSVLGRRVTVSGLRGQVLELPWARALVVSYHPSAILRAPDPGSREKLFRFLVTDLLLASHAHRQLAMNAQRPA